MLNELTPINALIGDWGVYVVTFDNWHSDGIHIDLATGDVVLRS